MKIREEITIPRLVLPVRGTIMAGWPSPAEEETNDLLSFDEWLLPHKEASVLIKIQNDAMRDAGILRGDTVVVERGKRPKIGALVVAEVDQEWYIRSLHMDDGKPILRSAHPAYSDIQPEELKIIGLVRAVIRRYA